MGFGKENNHCDWAGLEPTSLGSSSRPLVRNCYRVIVGLSDGNDLLNALLDRSRSLVLFQENLL